jgi:hypothetical protein
MKKLMYVNLAFVLCISIACNATKRAETKRKRDAEKMEQLEKDKKQFESDNQKDLGK